MSASTFGFHHVRAAIVFSDLEPFTSSSSILNKNDTTFTHFSASPSHTPSYIVRSRLLHSSSLLNSAFTLIQLLINLHLTSATARGPILFQRCRRCKKSRESLFSRYKAYAFSLVYTSASDFLLQLCYEFVLCVDSVTN
ncbi:unnamed protein product [Vicia faba]|uniref:Uncharacterized protein n=1 Tax=Vicia faba TaxID=3906 RepID=A0AAV1A193_VICFA|nr:unnamed protein product [Vicia faba]